MVKNILKDLGLVLFAAILFAAAFPNSIFINGIPLLAWFALVPVLLVIKRNDLLQSIGWGAVYGLVSYWIFNYWLGAFHPLAGLIVYGIYLVFIAVTFLFIKLAEILFPVRGYLVQWIIWLAYEYLCTLGFLGYSYGITGYSQWRMIPLIQIASITGVWGVSALVTFPSFWLAEALKNWNLNDRLKGFCGAIVTFFKKEKISAIIWAASLAAALIFGIASYRDFSVYPQARIALIQHNTDPWEASKAPTIWQVVEAYRNDLAILKRLSDEALSEYPKPQMVVWPETAFIPRIHWHYTYREEQQYWLIVRDLLEYLASVDVPFLIGNDDARRDPAKNPNAAESHIIDYNAAMLFENGINTAVYRKLHLVPFTEHFPYQKQLPFIYNMLIEADTHFWEKGDEATVFSGPGFTFSSPICFEDTFGYLSREFVLGGAEVLVNLSNDAWSNSLPAQYQHLSMAVFRAVENFRPMVRSTTSGQTCSVDPMGRVTAMARPFEETYLNVSVPIVKGETFYTKWGDYLGIFFVITAFSLLIFGTVLCTIRKLKKGKV